MPHPYLNEHQLTVLETHGGGDYAYFVDQITDEYSFEEAVEGAGDTLFAFMMYELADKEDCTDGDEAVRRMERARDEVQDVIDALRRKQEVPCPTS